MKTMLDYTTYCTEEQTRRAYALGAPIVEVDSNNDNASPIQMKPDDRHSGAYWFKWVETPTTQQMINWLREKGLVITVWLETPMHNYHSRLSIWKLNDDKIVRLFDGGEFVNFYTYEQAELAAIDAALDYLEKQSKQ